VTPEDVLLRARGVARRFGRELALAPADLEVRTGEIMALVGPNGAGKSTLLSVLAGALAPSEGEVERRDGVRVGWAPQRPAYYGRLTARENLELFARLEGELDAPGAATRLLDAFELPGSRPSSNLSVGNRQRLNLAIALLGDPQVLLLDEPSASLDPTRREQLWARVEELRGSGGAAVFATQNLDEVEGHADRLLELRDGRLVLDDAPVAGVA
jgi:ABC-2 type transport system ATP-binding protein